VNAPLLDAKVLTLEAAKLMMDASYAEAARNNWNVVIAIVDAGGELIMLHRRDGTQAASVEIARGKARTAVRFQRPTKLLEEAVAGGRLAFLAVEGMLPMEGGVPVVVGGRVIGAVGVSGVTPQQDAQVAQAGVNALGS
jgi:glc operon protein GlcG